MEPPSSNKRLRSDSDESQADSVEAKRILLDILDESDICTASQDLDSFMKTFQDQISPAPEGLAGYSSPPAESRPELGFLLEASDDELGLPPADANTNTNLSVVPGEPVEVSEIWGLDDEISRYGEFEFEFGYGDDVDENNGGEYVALDGLFDYSDLGFGSSDLSWRPETLPAK